MSIKQKKLKNNSANDKVKAIKESDKLEKEIELELKKIEVESDRSKLERILKEEPIFFSLPQKN